MLPPLPAGRTQSDKLKNQPAAQRPPVLYDSRMAKKPPDEFSAHEALDRSHLISTVFHEFIVENDFVESQPDLRRRAEEIGNLLGEFYQAVGRLRFDDTDKGTTPDALAKELGISPKTLRAFLRKDFARPPSDHSKAWELTSVQIAAARKRWPVG
jgi:hypothetical protein